MKYVYLLLTIYNIPFNVIFTSESFEDEEKLRWFFKTKDGHLKRRSVVVFRVIFTLICFLISLLSDDVSKILDIGGSFSTPILSYILPVKNFFKVDFHRLEL